MKVPRLSMEMPSGLLPAKIPGWQRPGILLAGRPELGIEKNGATAAEWRGASVGLRQKDADEVIVRIHNQAEKGPVKLTTCEEGWLSTLLVASIVKESSVAELGAGEIAASDAQGVGELSGGFGDHRVWRAARGGGEGEFGTSHKDPVETVELVEGEHHRRTNPTERARFGSMVGDSSSALAGRRESRLLRRARRLRRCA